MTRDVRLRRHPTRHPVFAFGESIFRKIKGVSGSEPWGAQSADKMDAIEVSGPFDRHSRTDSARVVEQFVLPDGLNAERSCLCCCLADASGGRQKLAGIFVQVDAVCHTSKELFQ